MKKNKKSFKKCVTKSHLKDMFCDSVMQSVNLVEWPLLNDVDVSSNQADAIANAFADFIWGLVTNE